MVGALKILPLVFEGVKLVEVMLGGLKKGRDKEDAAVQFVGAVLPLVEGGLGRDILDDEKTQDAVRDLIRATVSVLNAVRDARAKRAA